MANRIACFSDESGEYALHLRKQSGLGEVRKIALGNPPSYFYSPVWSPDSKKIAYTDKRAISGTSNSTRERRSKSIRPITTKALSPFQHRVVAGQQMARLPEAAGKSSARHLRLFDSMERRAPNHRRPERRALAGFDKNGKYLYFTASTDVGLAAGRHDSARPPGHPQRLCGRACQGPAIAARSRERRGKGQEEKKESRSRRQAGDNEDKAADKAKDADKDKEKEKDSRR